LRNPHLARLARKAGLVEKLGSGIQLIFSSCKEAGLQAPVYSEGNDIVKLRLYLEKRQEQESFSAEERLFSLLKMQGEVSIQEAAVILQVSRNTATRTLNRFIAQGRLQRKGKGPAVRYFLV